MGNGITGDHAVGLLEKAGLKQSDADRVHVRAGEHFFRQGERARYVFLLVEGRAKLLQVGANGQEVLLRSLDEGDFFCAAALGGRPRYESSAQAVEDSVAVRIEVEALSRSIRESPAIAREIVNSLVQHVCNLQNRFRDLATEAVPQRLAKALLGLSEPENGAANGRPHEIFVSGHELADLAATTSFTVSRWVSKWCAAGVLRRTRESILLVDLERLRGIAEGTQDPDASEGDE